MDNRYVAEMIARQRLEDTARQARTAHQRVQVKVRAGWHFPKISFPGHRHVVTARPV